MQIIPIKTRIINPPKDNLYDVINNFCPALKEGDVFLVTSKILAIHQGRCISMDSVKDKDALIKKEADIFISRKECPGEHVILTLKENTLIPSAGIDESNANGYYILWPENSRKEAKKICKYLKKKFSLKKLAVIITDSHSTPLRYGTMGISIGAYGLNPLKDYSKKRDIFGREIKMTKANIVDTLAVTGVSAMGEGAEQTPMAIIRDARFVKFTNQKNYKELLVPIKEDIYYPLLKNFYKKQVMPKGR
ncbi:coenzyme F420-0:L-glutamate ligase [Candidatus Parcubacteria bacterium]|nr:coenzyme F420-0:L-glutamate ligase [Candidatus Parcubacteria bacterium]